MKKFFLTIVLFVFAQLAIGQCYDINNFTATSSPSACPQESQVVVTAPTLTSSACSTATFTVELGLLGGGVPRTENVVTGQSVTFQNLSPGNYSVVLHDASGNTSTPKTVNVTSTFVRMNVTLGTLCGAQMTKTTSSSPVSSLDNGTIQYTIQGGTSIGLDFDVSLEDASGNQLVAPQRVTRTSVTADLTSTLTKILPTDRIPSGVTVYLVVKNVNTSTPSSCDEEKKIEITMPPAVDMPGTFGLQWGALTLRPGDNCKYSLGINIFKIGGRTVHNQAGCYTNDILTYFRANGRAKVEVVNRGITHYLDGTSASNPRDGWFNGWGYRTGNLFEDGDELRITIDDGFGNVLVRHFTLNTSIPTVGTGMSLQNQSSEATSCAPYLRLKVNFSNITTVNFIDITTGATIPISPYQWQYAYTRANWSAGLFKYEVEKLVSGTYTLVTHTEVDFDVIDVTSSGVGTYRVRVVPTSGCPTQSQARIINYATTDRFDAAFASIEKNYGIYDGTSSFRMPLGATSFFYVHPTDPTGTPSKAKLTITRADGQTSISFPTSLFLEETVTKTINFPIELPLVPSSLHPNGVNNVGLGDFPPGEYIFKLEDACGSGTRTITFTNQMSLRDASYTITKGCETSEISYTLGTQAVNRSMIHVQLQRKNASGAFVNVPGEIRNFSPTGSFANLDAGTYRLMTLNYYYRRSTAAAFLDEMWTMLPPFANLPQTGIKTDNPYVLEEVRGYSPDIEITSRSMNPFVSSVSCGTTNGSGLVFVDISQSNLPDEDITYILYEELAMGGTQTVTSVTVSSTVTSHHFDNLSDGRYKVGIKNNCGEYLTQTVEVNASAFQSPLITSSQNICPGTTATMEVNVSPSLYDIEWFRINPNTGATEGPFGINQKVYTDVVYTPTTYLASVKLKSRFNCGTNVSTPTTTVTMIPDTAPPTVVDFPTDQNLTLTAGTCTVSVTWTEPTVTDTCSVTVTSTHISPAVFTQGVHSVIYTFTDASGNSTTRTLQITVDTPAMESSLEGSYTDGGTTILTQLITNQLFYYEIKYSSIASETISTATLTVQLPMNSNVQTSTTASVDISGAGTGTTFVYNSATKMYNFTIPNYPVGGGVIKIPLQLVGGHTEAAKPCMNLQEIISVMTYDGGGITCLQTRTTTTSSTIEIDTSTYTRTHMQCTQGATITATTGFTSYQWYQGSTLLAGEVNSSYIPTTSGEYRVVKTILCGVRTVTSSETIDYHISADIVSVTMVKDKETCAELGQINVTAIGGLAPYRYMARVSTSPFPTETDFTTPSSTDVVTAFGNSTLDLPQGVYKLYVLDSTGCIADATGVYTITQAFSPTINTVQVNACSASSGGYNATVTVTFGEPTLSHSYTIDGGTPVSITTNTFTLTGLTSGVHTLTLIDANTCSDTHTFTVNPAIVLGTATLVQSLSCATPTTQITLPSISGGTGSYTYEFGSVNSGTFTLISSGTVIGSSITENVSSAGEYMFRIIDSAMALAGCNPLESNTVIVSSPQQPEIASVIVTPVSCNGLSNGNIQVSASPITLSPITFRIIQMRDLATGVASSVAIHPTATTSSTANFNSLAGTISGIEYTIELTANNGCTSVVTATVTATAPIVATSALSATSFGCSAMGALEAVLSFDVTQVSGGQSPYTWEYFDQAGVSIGGINAPTNSITNINGGMYYVEVRDASGCATRTNAVTVTPTFTLSNVVVTATTSITCLANEQISVSVTATPNYVPATSLRFTAVRQSDGLTVSETYSSTTTSTAINYTFVGLLPAGEYVVTVENLATSCSITALHTVADLSDKFEINVSDPTQPSCYQGNDGGATFTFIDKKPTVGGNQATNGFTYTITHLVTNQTTTGTVSVGTSTTVISNLSEGNYRIDAVSLANGCSVNASFVVPQAPSQMVVKATASPTSALVNCTTNQGDISVSVVSGGSAPYTINLTSVTQNETRILAQSGDSILFTGLAVGTYTITLTDALGCSVYTGTQSVALRMPNPLVASVTSTNVSCNGNNDGRILITNVSGGSGTNIFTYTIDNGTDPAITQTVNTFEGLKAGTYAVTISDNMGCQTVTTTTITEPTLIQATIDVAGSDRLLCYNTSNGYVRVTAQGGTQPYTIDIYSSKTNLRVTPISYVTPVPSNPVSASQVSITTNPTLASGTYYARVLDARGCAVTTTEFTIETLPNVEPREIYQDKDCRSNALYDPIVVRFAETIDAANTYYTLNGVRNTFSRVDGTYGYIDTYDRTITTQTITFEITKTHSDGLQTKQCFSTVWTINVEETQSLTAVEVPNANLNTIQVTGVGGVAPYSYTFNNKSQGNNPTYVLSTDDPGYFDTVTNQTIKEILVEVTDALGCTYTLTITAPYYDVEVPNFFTPDGDGKNDTWKAKNLENYPMSRTYIYDRHGRRLATLAPNETWDGIYHGKHMPAGDYWYVLELNNVADTRRFYGNFTLYR
ncbi:MAG: T9SS type B sorting domain-containing protein [Capnocytophaga sp.]|nr:T9SS type B sorting domain-containing protein [Capnocytophaga sp.]